MVYFPHKTLNDFFYQTNPKFGCGFLSVNRIWEEWQAGALELEGFGWNFCLFMICPLIMSPNWQLKQQGRGEKGGGGGNRLVLLVVSSLIKL